MLVYNSRFFLTFQVHLSRYRKYCCYRYHNCRSLQLLLTHFKYLGYFQGSLPIPRFLLLSRVLQIHQHRQLWLCRGMPCRFQKRQILSYRWCLITLWIWLTHKRPLFIWRCRLHYFIHCFKMMASIGYQMQRRDSSLNQLLSSWTFLPFHHHVPYMLIQHNHWK